MGLSTLGENQTAAKLLSICPNLANIPSLRDRPFPELLEAVANHSALPAFKVILVADWISILLSDEVLHARTFLFFAEIHGDTVGLGFSNCRPNVFRSVLTQGMQIQDLEVTFGPMDPFPFNELSALRPGQAKRINILAQANSLQTSAGEEPFDVVDALRTAFHYLPQSPDLLTLYGSRTTLAAQMMLPQIGKITQEYPDLIVTAFSLFRQPRLNNSRCSYDEWIAETLIEHLVMKFPCDRWLEATSALTMLTSLCPNVEEITLRSNRLKGDALTCEDVVCEFGFHYYLCL
jgi:hypothetical protein